MKQKIKRGEVKVVNAIASIHKILDEIAPTGKINCAMISSHEEVKFTFSKNGIQATFNIQKGGIA